MIAITPPSGRLAAGVSQFALILCNPAAIPPDDEDDTPSFGRRETVRLRHSPLNSPTIFRGRNQRRVVENQRKDASMFGSGRLASILLLGLTLGAAACASGCNTHNPSYFPYLLPFGDIWQTHAKPVGAGYYANFDPHAIRLEVRPMKDSTGQDIATQARTQYALLATVYDEKGNPRRDRRIEWMIEGAGHILEVDENGYLPGRGYKTSDKHAVSYTNRHEHRINRGDTNPANDFMVRPGQTWAVLSSAVEGDTHVTVYAPGIYDWEKNKVYTTIRWVDAVWEFPQPATAPAGSEYTFVTKLARATTKAPLEGYRVRYRIKEGSPAAYFLPDKSQEFTATSDFSGNAAARITMVRLGDQLPPPGTNNIDIEVIRPPDAATGSGVVIARGTTSIEWLAPNVVLSYTGPPAALVGEDVTYTASLQNLGKVASDGITLTAPVPRGMEFVRSTPPPMGNVNNEMLFTLGALPPGGQAANVQLTFRAKELGPTTSVITMRTGGQTDTKKVDTNIGTAKLDVFIDGPNKAVVNQPVSLKIRVVNAGGGNLEGILLKAVLKGGLVDPNNVTELKQELKQPLAPGQTFEAPLNVVGKMKGRGVVEVTANNASVGNGAVHTIDITEPMVNLQIDGPRKKYIGRDAEFTIRVTNPGDTPLNNVQVRDQLPPELDFVTAQDGQLQGRDVVWSLGSLAPGQSRDLKLVTRAKDKSAGAVQNVTVSSENAAPANLSHETNIFGVAGLRLVMRDLEDPVPAGGKAVYEVIIENTGTEIATGIELSGQIDGGLAQVLDSSGPSNMKVNGKFFTFEKVSLKPAEPGKPFERAVYLINVQTDPAQRGFLPPNGVFRVILNADALRNPSGDPAGQPTPVIEDENTTIYVPGPGGAGPAAPGVPAPLPPPPPPPVPPQGP